MQQTNATIKQKYSWICQQKSDKLWQVKKAEQNRTVASPAQDAIFLLFFIFFVFLLVCTEMDNPLPICWFLNLFKYYSFFVCLFVSKWISLNFNFQIFVCVETNNPLPYSAAGDQRCGGVLVSGVARKWASNEEHELSGDDCDGDDDVSISVVLRSLIRISSRVCSRRQMVHCICIVFKWRQMRQSRRRGSQKQDFAKGINNGHRPVGQFV